MSTVVYPPNPVPHQCVGRVVFLAGSIEMGAAIDWQARLIAALKGVNCTILNPRRPDWDSSWKQSKDSPQFRQQVEWELDGLDNADVIALYLDPATKSPISLLELGLFAQRDVIVCCPLGFWRKGNVDIVCERYCIPVHEDFDSFATAVTATLTP